MRDAAAAGGPTGWRDQPAPNHPGDRVSDHPPPSVQERLAALEAKVGDLRWWKNPGWWAVIFTTLLGVTALVRETKPWELFQGDKPKPPKTVHLTEAHAAAYAPDQWNANLRVVNGTSGDVQFKRVPATFGNPRPGERCKTRDCYPRPLPGLRATRPLGPQSFPADPPR